MPLNFPSNPSENDVYQFGNASYVFQGGTWISKGRGVNQLPWYSNVAHARAFFKRLAAESGFNLVEGSFEEGASVTGSNDVVWWQAGATIYSWHIDEAKTIPASSTPTNVGGDWIDQTNRYHRNFECIADVDGNVLLGQKIHVDNYYLNGDSGELFFTVVSAGTGTHDGGKYIDLPISGLQLVQNIKHPVSPMAFGAVSSDSVSSDSQFQNVINYLAEIAYEKVWLQDDSKYWGIKETIDLSGHLFSLSNKVTIKDQNRGLIIQNGAIKAISGGSLTGSDFLFSSQSGNTTYVTFENVAINLNRLCGGIQAKARWRINTCWIDEIGPGIGLDMGGSDCWADNCIIGEWTSAQDGFYDEANYVATAVRMSSVDCRLSNSTVRWSKELIRVQQTNCQIMNCHLFNGMEDFLANGGVGRTYHPLIVLESIYPSRNFLTVSDCYLDNGTIEAYTSDIHLENPRFASNSNHSRSDDLTWINVYAETTNDTSKVNITNAKALVTSRAKKLVEYHDYNGKTWAHDQTAVLSSTENLVDSPAAVYNLSAVSNHISRYSQLRSNRSIGTSCYETYSDNNTTGTNKFGVQTDQFVFSSKGGLRVDNENDVTLLQCSPITGYPVINRSTTGALLHLSGAYGSSYHNITSGVNLQITFSAGPIQLSPGGASGNKYVTALTDDTAQLGSSIIRWKEFFCTNPTINTSDAREKYVETSDERLMVDGGFFEGIPNKVLDAWANVPKVRFKWNSAIERENAGGKKARWHIGVLAQDVESAFSAEGLDANDYSLFCYDTWDAYTVEHVEESHIERDPVTGNEYKVIDAEAWEEEFPAGDRYGVRYEEAAQLDAALERRERKKLEDKIAALLA